MIDLRAISQGLVHDDGKSQDTSGNPPSGLPGPDHAQMYHISYALRQLPELGTQTDSPHRDLSLHQAALEHQFLDRVVVSLRLVGGPCRRHRHRNPTSPAGARRTIVHSCQGDSCGYIERKSGNPRRAEVCARIVGKDDAASSWGLSVGPEVRGPRVFVMVITPSSRLAARVCGGRKERGRP